MQLNGSFTLSERAIFLDRDGVLNKPTIFNNKPFAPKKYKDFHLYPKTKEIIDCLKIYDYKLIVVTNQKDVGMGITSKQTLNKMHEYLKNEIQIDEIFVCTCVDNCDCYKPNPGMLLEAKKKWNLDLTNCFMIGDSWRDIGAARNAGCKSIFIDRNYDMPMPYKPNFIVNSLLQAKDLIAKFTRENKYDGNKFR